MRALLPLLLVSTLLAACKRDDNYPDAPVINLTGVSLQPASSTTQQDSLIITVDFTDGNGDLGLTPDERGLTDGTPGNDTYIKFPYLDASGKPDSLRINPRHYNYFPVLYTTKRRFPTKFDSIAPGYVQHHLRRRYNTAQLGTDSVAATKYIDIWGFYSAFAPTRDMNQGRSLRGSIRFASPGIFIFPADPGVDIVGVWPGQKWFIKLFIMDRAGHVSNTVYSDTVTYVK